MNIHERMPEMITGVNLWEKYPYVTVPATGYSLSGPSTCTVGVASSNFTVTLTPSGGTSASVTITPSDGGGGGVFTPSTVALSTATPSATFTYTAASNGAKTISATNSLSLTNPGNLTCTASGGSLVDGDPVSSWADSSGAGHTATGTGSARPTFKTAIINGKPVVRFTSAGLSAMTLATSIPGGSPWMALMVMKPSAPANALTGLGSAGGPLTGMLFTDGNFYWENETDYAVLPSGAINSAFHVVTTNSIGGGTFAWWIDGTTAGVTTNPAPSAGSFTALGWRPNGSVYSNGDIAELIIYNGTLSLRAKTVLLLTVLLTTGQMPSEAELDAMVGDRHKIRRYLHQHGAHPTHAQLDAAVEPFAVGDRANVEKYLGTKYGITVAGGTAANPDTVSGLVGWWKADSL